MGKGEQLLHTPLAEELPQRLDASCAFANGETVDSWMPPVVRAIVLHFWLGYDHYFEDGKGAEGINHFGDGLTASRGGLV